MKKLLLLLIIPLLSFGQIQNLEVIVKNLNTNDPITIIKYVTGPNIVPVEDKLLKDFEFSLFKNDFNIISNTEAIEIFHERKSSVYSIEYVAEIDYMAGFNYLKHFSGNILTNDRKIVAFFKFSQEPILEKGGYIYYYQDDVFDAIAKQLLEFDK